MFLCCCCCFVLLIYSFVRVGYWNLPNDCIWDYPSICVKQYLFYEIRYVHIYIYNSYIFLMHCSVNMSLSINFNLKFTMLDISITTPACLGLLLVRVLFLILSSNLSMSSQWDVLLTGNKIIVGFGSSLPDFVFWNWGIKTTDIMCYWKTYTNFCYFLNFFLFGKRIYILLCFVGKKKKSLDRVIFKNFIKVYL